MGWSDDRVHRLIRQARDTIRVYNEVGIAKLIFYVRDDYDAELQSAREESKRRSQLFFSLLDEKVPKWKDGDEEEYSDEYQAWLDKWFWGGKR